MRQRAYVRGAEWHLSDGSSCDPQASHVYFQQAENWLIVQDGQNQPYLYNGSTLRRATGDEVPVGGPMAYGKGRLWVDNFQVLVWVNEVWQPV